jgi:seryl-tRNA synthetase
VLIYENETFESIQVFVFLYAVSLIIESLSFQLTAQLERIAKVNAEIRRKQRLTAKQARVLITEKADLQTQLQDKEQQIQKIKEHLDKECLESPSSTAPTSPVRFFINSLRVDCL